MRIEVSRDDPFGLHNLPYGVYRSPDDQRDVAPRVGVRLGEHVVDVGLLLGDDVFATGSLNAFMAQGPARWASVRGALTEALAGDLPEASVHRLAEVTLQLPFEVADYVDFYASEHHASNLGRLFRPDAPDPLTPNWKHLPIGYHGRSASIVVSGTDVVRPCGQRLPPGASAPVVGPSVRLDVEVELGFVVGTGSPLGSRIATADAGDHLFGAVLFNDWSARDIQAWEYVPLGPFLGKSFASTVSPWVVPMAALEGARVPVPGQEPVVPYLAMEEPWGLDIDLALAVNGEVVSRPPYAATYWSPAQMLAHLTVNGAPTRTGDLFASGTVSGPAAGQQGSLIEIGEGFLQDGDEVVISGEARLADGRRVGFGEAVGRVVPALPMVEGQREEEQADV
ncbi:fumarylacetoacetate hydrolase family protein [Nocardioides jiangxiensis]|uniref:fumarylacetoacetase n=1 Tax=Nocardioides jiangxiensis TaxID=3064524 RepID=A0ABT9B2R3_9ACTN|nr:fumarylacetoacetate hydrolase family protein [Nocardioides sp. WY-20]MDO7868604.1 fumarylacetoacetate hydrolase family protein [Nocardioides sp. WY-20]